MKGRIGVEDLLGKTLKSIDVDDDGRAITFITSDNEVYEMYHFQDCCEDVKIEDICGDLDDLIGFPLVEAEEVTNRDEHPTDIAPKELGYYESFTWTFYRFRTEKGCVTIRWFGNSNGYYSESVDFVKH